MNRKQKLSIVTLVGIALAISYWTGYFHGRSVLSLWERIISVALPVIFIWTLAKLTFAFGFKGGSLSTSGGGSQPPTGPAPGVRVPRPPGAPPVVHCEQTAWRVHPGRIARP